MLFRSYYDKKIVERVEIYEERYHSTAAPDNYYLGLVTAYCKTGATSNVKTRCPDWVNDSL